MKDMYNQKAIFLFLFPVICLFLAALAVKLLNPNPTFTKIENAYIDSARSDFEKFISDQPLNAQVQHEAVWSENDSGEFHAIVSMNIVVPGPSETTLRILLPKNIVVLDKGIFDQENLEEAHAFKYFVSLGPNGTQKLKLRYLFPSISSPYVLRLSPTQGGNINYKVNIKFQDYLDMESENLKVKDKVASWEGNISKDTTLNLVFKKIKKPLTIISAKIIDLNKIQIDFDRAPKAKIEYGDLNFSIIDLNYRDTEITDRIFIKKVDVDDKTITLSLDGMTYQYGENYKFSVKNVQDGIGNTLSPNPFEITLVAPK